MRLFENTNYNFIGVRRATYITSGVLVLISVLMLIFSGLETGIDFRGGTEMVVTTTEPLEVTGVRSILAEELGSDPEVKFYGSPNDLLIRTTLVGDMEELQSQIVGSMEAAYPGVSFTVGKTGSVSPRFSDDLRRGALYSVLASLFVIFVYILLRFGKVLPFKLENVAYPLGAVVGLAFNVIVTLGLFASLRHVLPFSMQVDQTIIAALLTIVAYSINDTIVIFDRIRERVNLFRTDPLPDTFNRSLNETLSRTIVTGGSTLLVVVVLFIFGGEVLRGFAFALVVGITLGTFSSLFISSPLALDLKLRAKQAG